MEPIPYQTKQVYLYGSMLFTHSKLLQDLYAESHRFEPWLIYSQERRTGHFVFPGALYVDSSERTRLLRAVTEQLHRDPTFALSVERRLNQATRTLVRSLVRLRRGVWNADEVSRAYFTCAQVLSAGVLKEALEPEPLEDFLSLYLAVAPIRAELSHLYQPRCLPHFVKFELKLLFFAEQWRAGRGDPQIPDRAAQVAGYLQRFLLEDGPLDDRERMAERISTMWRTAGGARGLGQHRATLLSQHQLAIARAECAEHAVLQQMHRAGKSTLASRRAVLGTLRIIRVAATYEELKHILSVRAARSLRPLLEHHGLDFASTDLSRLLTKIK
jgi:hypothetical protein